MIVGTGVLCLEPVVGHVRKETSPYVDSLKAGVAELRTVPEKHWWRDRKVYFNVDTMWFATDDEVSEHKDRQADWEEAMEEHREAMQNRDW